MTRSHPVGRLEAVLLVGVGGFAGSNLRYLFEVLVPSTLLATALVNVFGCFVLGIVFYEQQFAGVLSSSTRTVLATGFISSFTTYSTFVLDTLTSDPATGVVYLGGSYVLGFLAVLAGRLLVRDVTGGMGA